MIKLVLLAKRKDGMSREAFIDHYENVHVPLAERLFPILKTLEKRRNFIDHGRVMIPEGFSGEVNYDVITETIYPTRDILKSFLGSASDPALMQQLKDDEKNLFDTDSMHFFFVDVHESEIVPG